MKLYLAVIAAALHLAQGQGSSPCVPGVTCPTFNCVADSRCPLVNPPEGPVLFSHPNCAKFYKCSNGEACEYDCPAGLHFNPRELACDWPERACYSRCPINENPFEPTVLPHETNCELFYKCDLGNRCLIECPLGQHFSVQTGRCEFPDVACCDARVACTGVVAEFCVPDSRCTIFDDPFNPTILPHSDCGRFYKCSFGQACEKTCPLGQHFSAQEQRCERPDIACCDPSIPCTGLLPDPCTPDARCSIFDDPDNPTTLPHAFACDRFYMCSFGRACELPCPPGEHFDATSGRCDRPDIACCDNSIPCLSSPTAPPVTLPPPTIPPPTVPPPTIPPPTVPPPTIPPPTVPPPTPITPGPGPSDPCIPGVTCPPVGTGNCMTHPQCPPANGPNVTLFRHSDCHMFYKCDMGRACEMYCPAGLHFNANLLVCDWPVNACCDPTLPCNPPCIPGATCPPTAPTVGPPTLPPPTLPPPTLPPPTLPPPTLLPPTIPPPTLPPPTIPPPTLPPPTLPPPTLPPPGLDPCIPGVTCPPNDSGNCAFDSRCPSANGPVATLLPHNDCTMFYKCDSGKICEHYCPAGLHFNAVLNVCDWPSSACCDITVPCNPPCIPGVTCPPTGPTPGPPTQPPPTQPPPTQPPPTVPPPTLPPPTLPPPTQPPPTLPPPTLPPPGPDPCIPGVTCPPNDSGNCVLDTRCPSRNGPEPTLLPHNDCSKFYKCNDGKACEHYCPPGLHFNVDLKVCDWPSSACCDITVPCNPPCIPGVTCPPTGPTPGPPTQPPPTQPPPTQPPPTLPPPTLPPPTLPPPTQPPPTLPPPTLPPPTLPPPTLPPPGLDPCVPGVTCPPNDSGNCVVDSRCPSRNGPEPTLLPHSECSKFYKCNDGKACEHYCPPGLHFNVDLKVCDWPSSACCDITVPCNPPCIPGVTCPPTGPAPGPPTQPPPTVPPPTIPPPTLPPPTLPPPIVPPTGPDPCIPGVTCPPTNCHDDMRCPANDGGKPTLFAHTSCEKFYKCSNRKACEHNCPPGLHFNAVQFVCDWPEWAGCDPTLTPPCIPATLAYGQQPCDPSVTCPTFNCHPHPNCPNKDDRYPVLLPHNECDKFYKCSGGNACEQQCPVGLHYNAQEQACDWPQRARCDTTLPEEGSDESISDCIPHPECPVSSKITVLLPHQDCSKFYKCTGPFACPMDCPPLLDFNPKVNACDWPERACCNPTIPCDPCIPGVTCPPNGNCGKFYKCQTGRACEFDCPPGLHFNKDRMVCDWPHQACCDPTIECVPACIPGVTCP
ncbi:hypothetical protein ZHAS_00019368 [Anopheles sinensis]|uniref:Chitin-binding type-2 domain-containing protein n=1 Tax=Anopheles sinensis TaxID=74873 RepID=A0A084WM71_ANOSI|nr:hypothetical protein ZHAS_00019368 [Anopheles sinensis]